MRACRCGRWSAKRRWPRQRATVRQAAVHARQSLARPPTSVFGGPDVGIEGLLRRASGVPPLDVSAGRVQGLTACPFASPLRSMPPLDRRIARSGRCPGPWASPPSSPGSRLFARLRLAGGPWTSALVARCPCVEAAPKAEMFNHRGTRRRKAQPCTRIQLPAPPRAMRAARIVRAIRQPWAFPPCPPRTHPKQVGMSPGPLALLRGTAWTCGRS